MSLLDLLRGLRGSSHLTLSREGGRLRVFPRVPEPLRPLLVSYRVALLQALEERERVQALRFLEEPYRLVCLAVHTFPLEIPVVLTLAYGDAGKHLEDVRRYLAPVGNLSGYLLWAGRNLPPPSPYALLPYHRKVGSGVEKGMGGDHRGPGEGEAVPSLLPRERRALVGVFCRRRGGQASPPSRAESGSRNVT